MATSAEAYVDKRVGLEGHGEGTGQDQDRSPGTYLSPMDLVHAFQAMQSSYVAPWWEVVDVTAWTPYAKEARGRRPKLWIQDPSGGIWLWKTPPHVDHSRPHTARRSEPAVEVLALELARRAGVPVANAKPAIKSGERGVISRRFHESDEEHHPGAELLGLPSESGSGPDARRRRDEGRASATLERVHAKLSELQQEHGLDLLEPFARILVMDAWLGNGDRHTGNWALVTGPGGPRFAPMYDPTACLGVELTDERPELTASNPDVIARYARRCGSGFGGGVDGRTGIPMSEVLEKLKDWPEWRAALAELKPRILELLDIVPTLIEEIPDDWLSPDRKRFAALLLSQRVTLLP